MEFSISDASKFEKAGGKDPPARKIKNTSNLELSFAN
jgi:hypothetical protein